MAAAPCLSKLESREIGPFALYAGRQREGDGVARARAITDTWPEMCAEDRSFGSHTYSTTCLRCTAQANEPSV